MARTTVYPRLIMVLLAFLFAALVLYTESPGQFAYAIGIASKKSQIEDSYFEIYDKSSETVCNRLIVVKPFDWYILSRHGSAYVLNQTTNNCNDSSTPAAKIIDSDMFENVCLPHTMADIIDSFSVETPVQVPYKITGVKFNILDALNCLSSGYLDAGKLEIGNYEPAEVPTEEDAETDGGDGRSKRSTGRRGNRGRGGDESVETTTKWVWPFNTNPHSYHYTPQDLEILRRGMGIGRRVALALERKERLNEAIARDVLAGNFSESHVYTDYELGFIPY